MNQDREIRKGILYSSLNELLRKRMPEICERLKKSIGNKNYSDVILNIECSLEKHSWGQDTQWRIDAEVDGDLCDESGRPFGIGGYVFLEEVAGRKILYFKTQMHNSFDKTISKQTPIKIHYDEVINKELVETIIHQTGLFLDELYEKFMAGVEIFIREWKILKIESDEI